MLAMKYNKNMWNKTLVARIQSMAGDNEREQWYVHMMSQPKNEKYANGSVGARVRMRLTFNGQRRLPSSKMF